VRAKEFVINVPINITISGDGEMAVSGADPADDDATAQDTWVPPLQQKIELAKAALGKESSVIDQLVKDEDEPFGG
jgi:hypothetical protein